MTMLLHMVDEGIMWQHVVKDLDGMVKEKNLDAFLEKMNSLTLALKVTRFDVDSLEMYLPSILFSFLERSFEVKDGC